jgi:hypothetical protein
MLCRSQILLLLTVSISARSAFSQQRPPEPKAPPASFEGSLAKVMLAANENFRPIVGKPVGFDIRDSISNLENNQYYTTLVLPGPFKCRVGEPLIHKRWKDGDSSALEYVCVLQSGKYFTAELKASYEDLVKQVGSATSLPMAHTSDGSKQYQKLETSPGSRVFEGNRETTFTVLQPCNILTCEVGPYISVALVGLGGFGMGGEWQVSLRVGGGDCSSVKHCF